MRILEGLFLWAGIVFYLCGFMAVLIALIFRKDRFFSVAWLLTLLGFVSHTATIIVRWIISGHAPFFGTYEHFLAQSWFFMSIFTTVCLKNKSVRRLGVGVLPFCALLLGYGIMSGQSGHEPLPPPYRSLWLWAHAVSWFGYGAFFIANITAVLYLFRSRGYLQRMPEAEDLDIITYRMIVFGFVTLIIGMGAGAIWAYGLWGRYWAWDPVETWTLITWLVYGLNIHLRVSFGWKGERAAKLAIVSILSPVITLGGIGFAGGVHTTFL